MTTCQTTVPVEVEFYGPVKAGANPPIVRVYHRIGEAAYPDGTNFDVTHRCDISFLNSRTVSIKGKSGYFFLPTDQTSDPSNYVVVNAKDGTTLISPLCDSVTGNPPASVFTYTFELQSDCDADGNVDTIKDQCAKTGYCLWDINGDDFDLFVILFEAGSELADVDNNYFTNGEDYDAFVTAYEAGC